jgi:hypothetical protein
LENPVKELTHGTSQAVALNYDDKEVHHLPLIETIPPPTNSYWRMVLKKDEKK